MRSVVAVRGIKRQQGIVLQAGTAATAGLDGEADDENRREARADENGDGEDVHAAIGTGGGRTRIARLAIDCAYSPQAGVFGWPGVATAVNLRCA